MLVAEHGKHKRALANAYCTYHFCLLVISLITKYCVCRLCCPVLFVFSCTFGILFEVFSVQQATRNVLKLFFHLQIYCYHRQCSYFAQMFMFSHAFCSCFYCIILILVWYLIIMGRVSM